MKKIKIKVHLSIGFARATHESVLTIDVDDDATEDDINDAAEDATKTWVENYLEYGWELA